MSARSTAIQIATKAGMLLGGLFVFTILLAALPAHRPPAEAAPAQESTTQSPDVDHSSMPRMDMSDEHAREKATVHDMTPSIRTRTHSTKSSPCTTTWTEASGN